MAGDLQVPAFSTFITDPVDADVTVEFEIGPITGSFTQATGALTLSGTAGGTLTANGKHCTVTTDPPILHSLSTVESTGGASPRSGAPFTAGLTGAGAIAGQWTDMHATPVDPEPGGDTAVCETVDDRIGGPGGVWLEQQGDVVPPSAPQLTSTNPGSPSSSATPRILGAAEAGSTVRVYAGTSLRGHAGRHRKRSRARLARCRRQRRGRQSLPPSRRPPPTQPATPRPARRRSPTRA